MAKKNYICNNTVIGADELEGRYTKRPGDVVKLDPTDPETVRLVRLRAIRLDGEEHVAAPVASAPVPMENVDTTGDDANKQDDGLGDADDGLGDDAGEAATPPADKPLTAAQKKAASAAAAKPKR